MAGAEINPVYTPPHKGKGMFGSVLGGGLGAAIGAIGGALAAPATGGLSLAAGIGGGLAAGGGAGSVVGSTVGNAIDPGKSESMSSSIPKTDEPRSALGSLNNMPEVQMATMQDAKQALSTSSIPNAEDYMNQIDQAHQLLRQRLGQNSSMGAGR